MKSNFWEFDGLVRTLQMEGTVTGYSVALEILKGYYNLVLTGGSSYAVGRT